MQTLLQQVVVMALVVVLVTLLQGSFGICL